MGYRDAVSRQIPNTCVCVCDVQVSYGFFDYYRDGADEIRLYRLRASIIARRKKRVSGTSSLLILYTTYYLCVGITYIYQY